MRRVLVAGISGAGKTAVARRIADRLSPAYAHLTVARFARPRDTNRWIADLPSTKSPPGTG